MLFSYAFAYTASNKIYKKYIYIYIQEEIHMCVNVMPKCNHNLQRKIQRKEYKENENTFIQFL